MFLEPERERGGGRVRVNERRRGSMWWREFRAKKKNSSSTTSISFLGSLSVKELTGGVRLNSGTLLYDFWYKKSKQSISGSSQSPTVYMKYGHYSALGHCCLLLATLTALFLPLLACQTNFSQCTDISQYLIFIYTKRFSRIFHVETGVTRVSL